MDLGNREEALEVIRQAQAEGIHRDMFKSEIMNLLGNQSKYRFRGHAGAKKLGEDLGEIFTFIDAHWAEAGDAALEESNEKSE